MISTDIWGETPRWVMQCCLELQKMYSTSFLRCINKSGECFLLILVKRSKALHWANLRSVFDKNYSSSEDFFSKQVVYWQEIVDEFMIFNKYKSVFPKILISVFWVLAEASASSLPVCMNLEDQKYQWLDCQIDAHSCISHWTSL